MAFLKAVAAKDLDAVMKTVDAPFILGADKKEPKTVNKDELKDEMAKFLESVTPEKVMALKVGKAYDMTALAKCAKENDISGYAEMAEKLVGKTGYAVAIVRKDGKEVPVLLIRIKDGKAMVAGIPK